MRATRNWRGIGSFIVGVVLVAGADARGQAEKALREELLKLNNATTEELQTARLRALVKDREKAKKAVAEAAKMVKESEDKEKPFNYNGTMILGRAAHIVKNYDVAEKFYERQIEQATKLKSGKKILQAYDNLIDLYFDTKRYAEAADTCEKVMDLTEPEEVTEAQPLVLERLIQAKARAGKIDEAMNIAKGLIARSGGSWYFLRIKGWVEREDGKIDESIKTYTQVLDKLDAEKTLKDEQKDRIKDNIRYILSGLHVENKEVEKAAKELQTLIKRNPDNPTYKNDLGFIWCDHDMNLEESEKLIREALELDKKEKKKLLEEKKIDEIKENAAYLDSMGWVLFKQKKYKEAMEYLKKAAADEDEGNHMEIWDHLADCHMALGQKEEALEAWSKALKMDDISKRDGERRRKISEKLKTAKAAKG